jgi:signal transduction histidine kinase
LLDLTRIEQGTVALALEPARPLDLAAAALDAFTPRAVDAGLSLTLRVDPALPPVTVDRDRISHVFNNLLANAIAHTRRGGSIELCADLEPGFVRFSVIDNGEGIAAEHLSRVFDRFFRVPGARPGGAGLGLAITREIVEAHGGRIDVFSDPGVRTCFRFQLPISELKP